MTLSKVGKALQSSPIANIFIRILKSFDNFSSLPLLSNITACLFIVAGVRMTDGTEIKSTLVVDATGRSSTTATKLAEHGFEKPRLLCVNPHVSSASRMVKMPKHWRKNNDWLLLVCKTQPYGNRGGTLLPTEENRWQVTLAELGGPGPETNDEGFLEFAKSLPDQTMYNVLKQCEPVTPGEFL